MVRVKPFLYKPGSVYLKEGIGMGQKVSSGAIGLGCLMMFVGLCFLPAALGSHPEPAILGAGTSLFAMGALMIASGIYLKARVLQASGPVEPKAPTKRSRGGCDLCGTEAPVVNCRVHQMHLCGECLGQHYDFRSCVYVPSTRRPAAAKARAAKA
jgi:hypothetical protein